MNRLVGMVLVPLFMMVGCGGGGGGGETGIGGGISGGSNGADTTYFTEFRDTENPISEGGKWINGRMDGVDWSDVETAWGNATGTQYRLPEVSVSYDDSVAVLAGNWGPDQTVEGVVHAANRTGTGASGWGGNEYEDCIHEVELILRGNIVPARMLLYEVIFSSRIDGSAYTEIVKWSGAQGKFSYLSRKWGSQYQVYDGDIVKASIAGNTIRVYLNNTLVATATDSVEPITQGNPGMGFYTNVGCTGSAFNEDFGFKSLMVSASGG